MKFTTQISPLLNFQLGNKDLKLCRNFYFEQNSRAHSELGAEQLWLKILVNEQFDDAGCVLVDHDLTSQASLLVVGVEDATRLLQGLGNLVEDK